MTTAGPEGHDAPAGEMGVSSERVGPTGPGQVGTDGERDVSPGAVPAAAEPESESESDGEDNPVDDRPPKAGYPSKDPRSDEHPYEPGSSA